MYAKTDVRMKIGNCEQSRCLSKHTALRERICWQRRCYSVCKTLIPCAVDAHQPRVLGRPGGSRSLRGRRAPGLRLGETHRFFCLGFGVLGDTRGDHACPGAALPAGDMGTGASLPCKGQHDSFASEGKILFRSCICSAGTEQGTCPKPTARLPLLALGPEPGSGSSSVLSSLTPDYNLFLPRS